MYGGAPFGSVYFGDIGDTAKHATGSFSLSGGDVLAETGNKKARGTTTVSGGGSLASTDRHTANASFTVSGGGALSISGRLRAHGSFTLSGGGALTCAGRHRARRVLALSGGGALAETGTRTAPAVEILSGGGSGSIAETRSTTGTISVSGGPRASFTGRSLGHADMRGGGYLVETATKHAIASVTAGLPFTLGVDTLGPVVGVALSGGGSLAFTGRATVASGFTVSGGGTPTATTKRTATASLTLSGGGALAATHTRNTTGSLLLSGGGDGTILEHTHRHGALGTISGGGALAVVGRKQALLPSPFAITGGGDVVTDGVKGALSPIAISGGGDIAVDGFKGALADWGRLAGGDTAMAITAVKVVHLDVLLSGGGSCWGPYPWVLDPELAFLTPASTATVLNGERIALVLTAQGDVIVESKSVHPLELTRTGS